MWVWKFNDKVSYFPSSLKVYNIIIYTLIQYSCLEISRVLVKFIRILNQYNYKSKIKIKMMFYELFQYWILNIMT